jgi:hypothetical protein
MLKREALMESLSSNLNDSPAANQQKFIFFT